MQQSVENAHQAPDAACSDKPIQGLEELARANKELIRAAEEKDATAVKVKQENDAAVVKLKHQAFSAINKLKDQMADLEKSLAVANQARQGLEEELRTLRAGA
jgi:predicted RNase H-like nuclease (RuvC/YqgF family)